MWLMWFKRSIWRRYLVIDACRLANHLAHDVGKLGFRGTICNDEAKWEHAKVGHAPAIWFVFSGAALFPSLCIALPGK